MITVTLELADWQVIIDGVQNLPYRIAAPVVGRLAPQLQAPPQPKADGATDPAEKSAVN